MDTFKENVFKTIQHPKKLSTQIEEQLLDAINKGVFTAGDYLPSENKLVEIFSASRGVIREALLMLSAKGVIEIKKGKGAKLLKPSIDSLLDPFSSLVNYRCGNNGLKYVMEVRIVIEPYIVARVALEHEEKDIKKLYRCLHDMSEVKFNKKKLSYYDIEFHKNIWLSSGNPMFSILLEPIFHFLQKYHEEIFLNVSSENIDDTIYDHEKIIEAIQNKDSKAAAKLMEEHLRLNP